MKTASSKIGTPNIKTSQKSKDCAYKVQVKIIKPQISKSVPEYP